MAVATPLPADHPLTERAYSELQKASSLIAQGTQLCAVIESYGGPCDQLKERIIQGREINENMKRILFPHKV